MLKRIEGKLESKPKPQAKLGENEAEGKSKFASMREQRKKAESVSKFASMREERKTVLTVGNASQGGQISKLPSAREERKTVLSADVYWPSGSDVDAVAAIYKTVQSRSKKPLKRIKIINDTETVALPRPGAVNSDSIRCDDFVVVERKQTTGPTSAGEKQQPKLIANSPAAPATSTQFHLDWRSFNGNLTAQYEYLKRVDPNGFPSFFKDTLESEVLGGIIRTLSRMFVQDSMPVYSYLKGLSQVRRFSILSMFMSGGDKNGKQFKSL